MVVFDLICAIVAGSIFFVVGLWIFIDGVLIMRRCRQHQKLMNDSHERIGKMLGAHLQPNE